MADKKSSPVNKACYYVTFNVTDWIGLFVKPSYKQAVVDSLNSYIESKGLTIYAWCLMSNHLHMLARTKPNVNFTVTMRSLKKDISKKLFGLLATEPDLRKEWMLNRFELAGQNMKKIEKYQLWQNCSNPVFIDFTNKQLLWDHIRYIHENPVRDQVVEKPGDYLYSSARSYLGQNGKVKITVVPMPDNASAAYNELAAMLQNNEIKN